MLLLRLLDILSITLATLVLGVFWGPWVGVTRSIKTFTPDVFLVLVHGLDKNLGGLMGVLFPVTLLSIIPVVLLTIGSPISFFLTLGGLLLFVLALVVTAAVEVPIVTQIRGWTDSTMPADWEQRRDRWLSFHLLRVLPGIAGVILLVAGALWQS
jgi:uncharacterized membrane protein